MSRRALFLTPIYDPQVGGAAVHFKQLSTGLVENGTIDSFVIITASSSSAELFEATDHGRIFRVLFSPKSIHKRWSKPKVASNYVLATMFTIIAMLVYRVSTVHTHTKPYFSFSVRVANLLDRNVIIDGRDLGAPSFPPTGDVFVCISRNIEEKTTDRDEEVLYIPVGIDSDELDVGCENVQTPAEPYLLFVGDIAPRKGVPELMGAISASELDRKLILIGEHIDSGIDLQGPENVTYLGALSHEIVLCYIREADLVILPSEEEALGRVILEALFHQTDVICPPNVPEYRENLPDQTLTSVSVEEIQKQVEKVLSHEREPGEYPIERHFLPNVLSEYDCLYKSILS